MLEIRTHGRMMVGTDFTKELSRPPIVYKCFQLHSNVNALAFGILAFGTLSFYAKVRQPISLNFEQNKIKSEKMARWC